MRHARAFIRLQLGLAIAFLVLFLELKKSKESAAAKTAKTWTPEVAPASGDDLEVVSPNVVKFNSTFAAKIPRSLVGKTGATVEITVELPVGAATAGPENVCVNIEGSQTGEGILELVGTFTTTAQTISVTPTLKVEVKFTGTGKWKLLTAFKTTQKIKLTHGTLEGNGQTIEAVTLESSETSTLDVSGCTVIIRGGGGTGWHSEPAVTLTTTSATVIEIGTISAQGQFGGGRHTYKGTVKLIGREFVCDSEDEGATPAQTIEHLEVLNKGTGAKGGVFKAAATTSFTSSLNFNGKAGELARVESKTASSAWKLKGPSDYEPANSFVAIKDCKYEGGTLYLPNGEDLGGNENIKFEPSGEVVFGKASGTLTLTGTSAGTVRSVIAGQASGALLLGGTAKGSVAGAVFGKAAGALTLTGAAKATVRAVITGKATGTLLLTGTATGHAAQVVAGKAAGVLLLTGTAKGTISGSVTGKAFGTLTLTGSAKAVSLTHPPTAAGVTSPHQTGGRSSPRQLVGAVTPTQRRGSA